MTCTTLYKIVTDSFCLHARVVLFSELVMEEEIIASKYETFSNKLYEYILHIDPYKVIKKTVS